MYEPWDFPYPLTQQFYFQNIVLMKSSPKFAKYASLLMSPCLEGDTWRTPSIPSNGQVEKSEAQLDSRTCDMDLQVFTQGEVHGAHSSYTCFSAPAMGQALF